MPHSSQWMESQFKLVTPSMLARVQDRDRVLILYLRGRALKLLISWTKFLSVRTLVMVSMGLVPLYSCSVMRSFYLQRPLFVNLYCYKVIIFWRIYAMNRIVSSIMEHSFCFSCIRMCELFRSIVFLLSADAWLTFIIKVCSLQ